MRISTITAASMLAIALAGCSGGKPTASDQSANMAETAPVASASPASSEPEKPDCSNLPKGDDKPDNDIAGIDMGMNADDALRIAKCNAEGFRVEVKEDDSVTLPDGSHPRGSIVMEKDNDRIDAFLVGVPGQEKVVALMRGKAFPDGEEPTMDQMRADIAQKYNPVSPQVIGTTRYGDTLVLALTPDGQRLPDDKVSDCTFTFGQTVGVNRNALGQLKEQCGVTKKIELRPKGSNRALVGAFSIWIGDQNGVFKAARATGAAVQAMHAEKRDAEAKKAASESRTPNL